MKHKSSSLLLLSTICLALAAQAGEDTSKASKEMVQQPPSEPRFFLSLSPGGEFDIHATKFIGNGSGDVGVPGAFSLPIKIQSRDFAAVHDAGVINGNLEFGYTINDLLTVFGGFTYSHSNGDSHGAGRVTDPSGQFGNPGGVYEVEVSTNKYQAYAGRAGVKITLPRTILNLIHAPKAIKPYFSASAGGKYVESSSVQVQAGNFLNEEAKLYDDSFVFNGELNFGYDVTLARNFSVVLESGYGYDSKLDRGGQNLRGISSVDPSGDRLYSTVSLGGKYKF